MRQLWPLVVLIVLLAPQSLECQTAPYLRTVVVSPVVGNPTASGTALRAAISGISATAADRWLVKVEPGTYNIGNNQLNMKPYVDVEGSGPLETEILGEPNTAFDPSKGMVNGADNSELRDLTVTCKAVGGPVECIAIANYFVSPRYRNLDVVSSGITAWGFRNTAASPSIDEVRIDVNSSLDSYGIVNADDFPFPTTKSRPTIRNTRISAHGGSRFNIGILNKDDSSPVLVEDVSIEVENGSAADGILALEYFNTSDTMTLRRVTIDSSSSVNTHGIRDGYYTVVVQDSKVRASGENGGPVYLPIASLIMTHSEIEGVQFRVYAESLRIGSSWLQGSGFVEGLALEQCAGVFDSALTFYPNTCP